MLKRRGRAVPSISVIALVAGLLVAVPSVPAAADSAPDLPTLADLLAPAAAPGAPLSHSQRMPESVEIPQAGYSHVDQGSVPVPSGASAADAVASLLPLPAQGGPDYDVYGTGDNRAAHYALLHPSVENAQDTDGNWGHRDATLSADGYGWSAQIGATAFRFPKNLDPSTPIRLEFPDVTATLAPTAAKRVSGSATADTLTYPGATSWSFRLHPGGYKEEVSVPSAAALSNLSWDVKLLGNGSSLVADPEGTVSIISPSGPVAFMPVAISTDAAGHETIGTYSVAPQPGNRYKVSVTLDATFLATATYPIKVDPGTSTLTALRDTYVDEGSPKTSFDGQTTLKVDTASGHDKRTFVRFDTTAQQSPTRLVYGADLRLWANAAGPSASVDARGVTSTWPTKITWNAQPTAGGVRDTDAANAAAFSQWDLADLYQGYIGFAGTDQGVTLRGGPNVVFAATEDANAAHRPSLLLTYNDLPPVPVVAAPKPDPGQTDAVVESDSPILRVDDKSLIDPNGDDVLVKFQVASSPTGFGSPVAESNFTTERSFQVPSGQLQDGTLYYWRAIARDVCPPGPDTLCPLVDGAGGVHAAPTSAVSSFKVSVPHLGTDWRYGMFSKTIGNDVSINVNEANGNLALDVPLDSTTSSMGDIYFGLSYNSQDPTDLGLGAGWQFYAGPGGTFPTRLIENAEGVSVEFSDGARHAFALRSGSDGIYSSLIAGDGDLAKNEDGSFTYTPTNGGAFTYNTKGALSSYRPAKVALSAASTGAVFTYTADASGHLLSVKDELGRALVSAGYSGGKLTGIGTFDGRGYGFSATPSLVSIGVAGGSVQMLQSAGVVSEIRDGAISALGHAGWQITYDSGRVSQILPPPGGAATSPDPWVFTYQGPFTGQSAARSTLTDPRGFSTGDPADYMVTTDFTTTGLPALVAGPADQHGYLPLETMQWDSTWNLLCDRSPEANAIARISDPAGCGGGDLSTEYSYQDFAPFRMTEVFHPAPAPGGSRVDEVLHLDQGLSQGLTEQVFNNTNLSAVPAHEKITTNLAQDFGASGPGFGVGINDWSLKFKGLLTTTGSARAYKFLIASDDGVRLSVANQTLVNCFGSSQDFTLPNCQLNSHKPIPSAKIALPAGTWPITIKYSELKNNARFDFKWDAGGGSFMTIPGSVLSPKVGLVTATDGATASDGSSYSSSNTYLGDEEQTRRLPEAQAHSAGGDSRSTRSTYDDFGRVLQRTTAAGSADASTSSVTTFQAGTMCAATSVDPIGAVFHQACNARGQVTSSSLHVTAQYDQPAQVRTTTYAYDGAGRLTTEDPPGDAITTYGYDASGRMISQDTLADSSIGLHAVTSYSYDDAGDVISSTQPAQGAVTYTSDWAGNQLTSSDPRGGGFTQLSQMLYDARNREITHVSPSGLVSTTDYDLSGGSKTTQTDPAGVATVSFSDVLGQETSSTQGSLDGMLMTYDQQGNPKATTDSSGVTTTETYDAFGEQKTSATGPSTTTTTFDKQGRESTVDGPGHGSSDRLIYSYDAAGHLTDVQQAGLPSPNTNHMTYDEAGDLLRISQPMGAGQTMVRTFTYDERGNQISATDARGTTYMDYTADNHVADTFMPNGYTIEYDYNAAGQPTREAMFGNGFQAGSGRHHRCAECNVRFAYDAAGNTTQESRDGRFADMAYDEDNRVVSVTPSWGPAVGTAYEYDPGTGQLANLDAATHLDYAYNANGMVSSIVDSVTGDSTDFTYDGAGRVTGRTDPASLTWTRTYEPTRGLVDTQTITGPSGVVGDFNLDYDATGNVVTRKEIVAKPGGGNTPGSGTWTYSYDNQNRMISATDPTSITTQYSYDNTGNRTSVQVGSDPAITTAFDDAGVPVSSSDGTTYISDEAGNLTGIDAPGSSADRCFFVDGFNLTRSMKIGSATGCSRNMGDVQFLYDGWGRTVTRDDTRDGGQLTFGYQGTGEDLASIYGNQNGTFHDDSIAYSPMGALLSWTGSSQNVRFLTKDLHGDAMSLVDTSGSVTGSKLYSPWGETAGASGDSSFLGFQSQYADPDTGFVDMASRLYAPQLGRFSSRDSLFGDVRAPGSLNSIGYGWDAPVNMVDPSGMKPLFGYSWSYPAEGATRDVIVAPGTTVQVGGYGMTIDRWGFTPYWYVNFWVSWKYQYIWQGYDIGGVYPYVYFYWKNGGFQLQANQAICNAPSISDPLYKCNSWSGQYPDGGWIYQASGGVPPKRILIQWVVGWADGGDTRYDMWIPTGTNKGVYSIVGYWS